MSSSKTAFLFVPGAWCPGYYYHKVTEKLQSLGYEAKYVDLPSVGKKDNVPGLEDDAAHVRSAATSILSSGKDLVIVGNSYGGFVTTESCKGLVNRSDEGGKLKHTVLIGSILAERGQTMKDLVGDQAPIPTDPVDWIEPGPVDPSWRFLFGSLSEEEGIKYGNMAQAQALKPLLEPLTFAGYEEVPCTMAIGEKDLALKPETQHGSFEKAMGRGVKGLKKVVIEAADHVAMLGSPNDVVKICLEAAE